VFPEHATTSDARSRTAPGPSRRCSRGIGPLTSPVGGAILGCDAGRIQVPGGPTGPRHLVIPRGRRRLRSR
jgi:hypothetical protein